MKKILIIALIVFGAFIFKIPEYRELNNIAIIEGIAIDYDGYNYTVYLKEVIPVNSDRGIDYEYKYYKEKSSTRKTFISLGAKSINNLFLRIL